MYNWEQVRRPTTYPYLTARFRYFFGKLDEFITILRFNWLNDLGVAEPDIGNTRYAYMYNPYLPLPGCRII
jgi:hypothetical protein